MIKSVIDRNGATCRNNNHLFWTPNHFEWSLRWTLYDRHMDGRYQTCYLPFFAVDKYPWKKISCTLKINAMLTSLVLWFGWAPIMSYCKTNIGLYCSFLNSWQVWTLHIKKRLKNVKYYIYTRRMVYTKAVKMGLNFHSLKFKHIIWYYVHSYIPALYGDLPGLSDKLRKRRLQIGHRSRLQSQGGSCVQGNPLDTNPWPEVKMQTAKNLCLPTDNWHRVKHQRVGEFNAREMSMEWFLAPRLKILTIS